ncbi:hypothetical protein ACETWI_21160 [Aeromonas hydrophila]|uniref:hypothetical protein n=1 Tax=Aeromonas hydrophila TaxID=644 RepID=UPI0035A28347
MTELEVNKFYRGVAYLTCSFIFKGKSDVRDNRLIDGDTVKLQCKAGSVWVKNIVVNRKGKWMGEVKTLVYSGKDILFKVGEQIEFEDKHVFAVTRN